VRAVFAESSPPDPCVVIGLIVLLLLVVAAIGAAIEGYNREQQRQQEAREARERRRECERQRELQREKARLEQESQQALMLAVAQLKDAAEERFKASLTAGDLEELDQRVREAQLVFSRTGRVLTARVYAVPTGWVAVEWMLDPSHPQPLRVVGKREGEVVFVEHAYRGVYADVLPRGREYTFELEAYDGDSPRERGFKFVVKIPTPKQWRRKVSAAAEPDALAKQQKKIEQTIKLLTASDELWEQARRESHQKVDAAEGSDADKRRRKARLDAQIAQERDKDEP